MVYPPEVSPKNSFCKIAIWLGCIYIYICCAICGDGGDGDDPVDDIEAELGGMFFVLDFRKKIRGICCSGFLTRVRSKTKMTYLYDTGSPTGRRVSFRELVAICLRLILKNEQRICMRGIFEADFGGRRIVAADF